MYYKTLKNKTSAILFYFYLCVSLVALRSFWVRKQSSPDGSRWPALHQALRRFPKRDCLTSPSTPGGNRVFLGGWPLCTNPRISGGAAPNNPSLEFFKDISMRGGTSPPGYPISTPSCPAIWPMFIRPLTSMLWRFCDTDCSMVLTSELPTGWLGFPGDSLDNRLCRMMLDWEAYGSPSNDGFSDCNYTTARLFKEVT